MNNQTKQKRFRLFDALSLFVIIILIAIACLVIFNVDLLPSKKIDVTYTVALENVPTSYHGLIKIGDTVCDDETGSVIGTVTDLSYSDAYISKYAEQARYYVNYTYPDKENVLITVSVNAELKDDKIIVDSFTIAAGKKLIFRVPSLIYGGEIAAASINAPIIPKTLQNDISNEVSN